MGRAFYEIFAEQAAAHPYLNASVFADEQGNFRVRRDDSLPAQVDMIETAHLPERLVTPFTLLGGRLYRAAIYCTEEGPWLFLDFHHIVSDGTSTAVFIHDVNEAYAGRPAESVVALSSVENFTVFHASNSHSVQMGDVVESLNRCQIPVEAVEDSEFQEAFQAALNDEELSMTVSPLITYQVSDRNTVEFNIGYDNAFTTKALYRLRVKWPIISEEYLDQVFTALRTIGFFDLMTDE